MSETTRRRRILIVDDEPTNVRVLAEALGPGYEIHFATSGGEAIAMAGHLDLDLVLLDVVMPGIDGYEVLRRLRADEALRAVPVIFVTAKGEVEDEELGFQLGAVDYIAKPVSPPIVRARVRTHLELKEQRDLLERRASIDGLTGIANRRRFDEKLAAALRSPRGEPMTVFLLDVDFFKQFNDRYGHAGGDDCLRKIAAVLPEVARRPTDLAARYGGEEFVLLFPDTGAAGGRELAAGLLARVARLAIPHEASKVGPTVTVSVGAVTIRPGGGETPVSLLERADQLLYSAKEAGRNRCVHLDAENREETSIGGDVITTPLPTA